MEPDLQTLANDLASRFPELEPVAPLTVLGSGFGNLVVETASGAVFRVARDPRQAPASASSGRC